MILFPISIVASLLYSSLTAGLAIPSSPAIEVISPNITNLADDHDLTHCSSDHASYGQIRPGSVACILAIRDLLQSPKITRLPNVYPMKLLSSTASLPTLGNGFRTPWRSTFRESTIHGQYSLYRVTEAPDKQGIARWPSPCLTRSPHASRPKPPQDRLVRVRPF